MISRLFFILSCLCFLASCEKEEKALVLPPPGTATPASVEMGPDYDKQTFYDFETGMSVFSSDPRCWDLSFEATPEGKHVFINGAKDVFVYNTHLTNMNAVTELPANLKPSGSGWSFDAPCGMPDSTGIGDWFGLAGETRGEVYIVQTKADEYRKMRILTADASHFTIEWADLNATGTPTTVMLPKDSAYNFIYFSFSNGTVKPEPLKNTWDIVFTRYRHVFHTQTHSNFPYTVTGVLLNPSKTKAAADSTIAFGDISLQKASSLPMSHYRDVIGFDWKDYSFSSGRYEVNRAKNYVVQTRKDQLYKFRFLEFYNSSGQKGYPSFEYERLH